MVKKIILTILIFILVFIVVGFIDGLMYNFVKYEFSSEKIEEETVIIQISDLHSSTKESDYENMSKAIAESQPDFVVLTGDIVTSTDNAMMIDFLGEVAEEYPTYYVPGNHEYDGVVGHGTEFSKLELLGITHLDNENIMLDNNINLIGLNDHGVYGMRKNEAMTAQKEAEYAELIEPLIVPDAYNILLIHRPHYEQLNSTEELDLILSGHIHQGQFRLPILNICAVGPDQGLFPEYCYGHYDVNGNDLIIHGSSTNDVDIPRFYAAPEIVEITLKPE